MASLLEGHVEEAAGGVEDPVDEAAVDAVAGEHEESRCAAGLVEGTADGGAGVGVSCQGERQVDLGDVSVEEDRGVDDGCGGGAGLGHPFIVGHVDDEYCCVD